MAHRIHSLDYLKLLLAIGVAFGHAILMQNQVKPWSYLIGMGLLRGLVPTFAAISGYSIYVTQKRGKLDAWLKGLIAVYLFWMAFYLPVWFRDMSGFEQVLQTLVFGIMHLWYIAGLVLALPLMLATLWLGRKTGTGIWPMLGAALILALAGSGLAFWSYLVSPLPLDLHRNGITVIFPFAAAGYAVAMLVDQRGREALPSARALWLAMILLGALKLGESAIVMQIYGVSIRTLPDLPFLAIPFALLMFLAFLRLDLPRAPVNLGLWSASIYFLHILMILIARHFGIMSIWATTLLGIIVPILLAIAFEKVMAMRRRPQAERGVVRP